MKGDLKNLLQRERSHQKLNFSTDKFHGNVAPVSFRTYQGVADDFRAFAAGIKGMKNQELVAQALIEFMEKYETQSLPTISLILGSKLCKLEKQGQKFSRLIKEARSELVKTQAISAPQIRIYDNQLLEEDEFMLKTDDGREFSGFIKSGATEKLKAQLKSLMHEKSKT